jgi:hypothetical protein
MNYRMKEEYSFGQRSFYRDASENSTERLLEMLKEQNSYGPENIRVINDILEERKSIPVNNEEAEIFMNSGLEGYETPAAEAEKYWICPSCKKLVGIEFAVCWSCQAETPINLEHPDKEDIIKDRASENIFKPVRTGFSLVAGGLFVGLLGFERDYFRHLHWGRFLIGALALIVGIALIIFGLSPKFSQDKRQK